MLTNRQEVIFFSSLGLILVFFFIASFLVTRAQTEKLEESNNDNAQAQLDISIEAKAAYVYDLKMGTVLFAKNEETRLPLASLTKLMTALVASDIAGPDKSIVVSREALFEEGDTGLLAGERWKLKDLLDFSLVTSANDGLKAIALALSEAEESFVEKMNRRAGSLGMKNTYYLNETGLDESAYMGGAYSSAKDQALLLSYILKYRPTLLSATRETELRLTSLDQVEHLAINTNVILGEVPRILASKTGYTTLAGGNLVMAFDPEIGRTVIISLLGSSESGRFADMEKIIDSIIGLNDY